MKTILFILLCMGTANAEVVREISGVITKDNVNGRVGVNLSNGEQPTATLDVNGGIKSNGSTTMTGPLTLSGSSLTVTGTAFSVGGSTLVVSGGNVGIGTANPGYQMSIQATEPTVHLSTWAGAITDGSILQQSGSDLYVYNQEAGKTYIGANNAIKITAASTGVGVGTSVPGSALDVVGTGVEISSSTNSTAWLTFKGSATKAFILAYDPVNILEVWGCTDCATSLMCASTGTAVGQMGDAGDRTAACN